MTPSDRQKGATSALLAAESAVEPYQWSFFGDLFGGSGSVGAPRSSKAARTFDEASVRELDVDQLDLLARFLVRCGAVVGAWSEHDEDGEGVRRRQQRRQIPRVRKTRRPGCLRRRGPARNRSRLR